MKTKTLFIILFTLSHTILASELKTDVKGDTKKIYFDYNDDKKIDLIETYEKNILVKKEQDIDFDGFFDETTEYFYDVKDDVPAEIITKKDRKSKVYKNKALNKIITITEIDTDGDGKYDKIISENIPLIQENDPCLHGKIIISNKADNLMSMVSKATGKMNNGFIENEMGYKIHQSCIQNYGATDFSKLVTRSMQKGLQCLKNLADQNTKSNPKAPNGALNNFKNLTRLLANEKVTIACHEKTFDWKGVAGHASTGSEDKIESLNIKHPFISLSPNKPEKNGSPTKEEIQFMSQTIFHEQLHNLGIKHGEGVEYPYSCETCCLTDKEKFEGSVKAACKVCAGQYETKKGVSKEYLKDSLLWGESVYDTRSAARSIYKYQQENPKDQSAAILAARANADSASTMGIEMAKILNDKLGKISQEDQDSLVKALTFADRPFHKAQASKAKVLAQSYLEYYYENNPEKAMAILETNKQALKGIIAESKKKRSDILDQSAAEKLLSDTKSMIVQIWFHTYPKTDTPVSQKAYDLLQELKL